MGSSNTQHSESRQQPGSACDECRKRKLRCDRRKPQCLNCANSGVNCVTNAKVAARGPKKGHVDALRNKIAELEAKLKDQASSSTIPPVPALSSGSPPTGFSSSGSTGCHPSLAHSTTDSHDDIMICDNDSAFHPVPGDIDPCLAFGYGGTGPDLAAGWLNHAGLMADKGPLPDDMDIGNHMPMMDMPSMGLELTSVIRSDLNQLYFERLHPFVPLIDKTMYLSWAKNDNKSSAQLCLQYSMWTLASVMSSQFQIMRMELYAETNRLLQDMEANSEDATHKPFEQLQAWILRAVYDLISNRFERGLVSAGRAFRLVQLLKLNKIDAEPSRVTLPSGCRDVEYLRRAFWIAYKLDCFLSMANELTMTLSEGGITTRLPSADSTFTGVRDHHEEPLGCFLSDILNSDLDAVPEGEDLSPLAESVVITTICARVFHLKDHMQEVDCSPDKILHQYYVMDSFLKTRLQSCTSRIVAEKSLVDSTPVFLALTIYMALFTLYDAVKEMQQSSGILQEVTLCKKSEQHMSVEVKGLIQLLRQFNHFEIQPMAPISLLLIGRLYKSRTGADELSQDLLRDITTTLQDLANINGLAIYALRCLGPDVE